MKIKGKFEIDIPEKLLKDAKQLGWTKEHIKAFIQDALDGWVQNSVYESICIEIENEKETR
jgi:hypothetical protein